MNRPIWTIAGLAFIALVTGQLTANGETPESQASVIRIRYVTVLVKDYDEALAWYTQALGLKKSEDRPTGPGRRWLVVAPEGQSDMGIVLDIPHGDTITADRIGKETNWVFDVADCEQFFKRAQLHGVHFLQTPKRQPWGTVQAIFEDPYGNIYVAESSPPPTNAPKNSP